MHGRLAIVSAALAAALFSGCAGTSPDGTPSGSASPSVEVPTASFTPPNDYQTSPTEATQLNSIQPDGGAAPVVDFINSAAQSIDVSI